MQGTVANEMREMLRIHDQLGSDLRVVLRPGLDPGLVERRLRGCLGMTPARDLVSLYAFCDGTNSDGPSRPPPIAPMCWISTFADAEDLHREQEELAEFEKASLGRPVLVWRRTWWPCMAVLGANFIVVDSVDGAVWLCNLGSTGEVTRLFDDLASFLAAVNWASRERIFYFERTDEGWPIMGASLPEVETFAWLSGSWPGHTGGW